MRSPGHIIGTNSRWDLVSDAASTRAKAWVSEPVSRDEVSLDPVEVPGCMEPKKPFQPVRGSVHVVAPYCSSFGQAHLFFTFRWSAQQCWSSSDGVPFVYERTKIS